MDTETRHTFTHSLVRVKLECLEIEECVPISGASISDREGRGRVVWSTCYNAFNRVVLTENLKIFHASTRSNYNRLILVYSMIAILKKFKIVASLVPQLGRHVDS